MKALREPIYVARKDTTDGQLKVTVKRTQSGHYIIGEHHPTHGSIELLDAATVLGRTDEEAKHQADRVMAGYIRFHQAA